MSLFTNSPDARAHVCVPVRACACACVRVCGRACVRERACVSACLRARACASACVRARACVRLGMYVCSRVWAWMRALVRKASEN